MFTFFFLNDDEYYYRKPREVEKEIPKSLGTGMIIRADGYVLTNYHVVENVSSIEVILASKDSYPAKIVGVDKRHDIAVIKIDAKGDLPVVALGDSDSIKVGQWVISIGNPFGYENTVTVGVISAKGRIFEEGYVKGEYRRIPNIIQTDAAINPGNSGGPLLNIYGEVIGVNMAIASTSGSFAGIGFAVPVNDAKAAIGDLIKGKKVSEETPGIGVRMQRLDEGLLRKFRVSDGILVAGVDPGSPADKAGIKSGDVIVAFNGKLIDKPEALSSAISSLKVGDEAEVGVVRAGSVRTFKVKLGILGKWNAVPAEEVKSVLNKYSASSDRWFSLLAKLMMHELGMQEEQAKV